MARSSLIVLFAVLSVLQLTNAFTQPALVTKNTIKLSPTVVAAKKKVDLSDIETRDMTKKEMLELNKQNEEIMNMELQMMTGFSAVISLPILYLCWVAFNSD